MNELFLLLVLGSIPSSILWVFFWCSISFFFSIFSIFFFINFWPSAYEYTQNVLVLKEQIFSYRYMFPTCLCAQWCPAVCNLMTIALQAPLSMGFSRQEYWSGLPFSPPGDLLTQGSNSHLLHWQVDSTTEPPGSAADTYWCFRFLYCSVFLEEQSPSLQFHPPVTWLLLLNNLLKLLFLVSNCWNKWTFSQGSSVRFFFF